MMDRMKSRIHLEGGAHVDVSASAAVIRVSWKLAADGAFTTLRSVDGMCLIPVARVVWVSTLPQSAADAPPVERGGSGL